VPYRNEKKQAEYLRKYRTPYMRRYRQKQMQKLLEFKQKYPKIYREIFGEPSASTEHAIGQPKKMKKKKRKK